MKKPLRYLQGTAKKRPLYVIYAGGNMKITGSGYIALGGIRKRGVLTVWFEPKEKTLHSGATGTANGQIFDLDGRYGAVRLQITGITSATITFEQSNDGGTTWDGLAGTNTETGVKATTVTADGTFLLPVTGIKKLRARISTYVTGTIYVFAVAVPAIVAPMEVYSSLLAGTALVGKVGIDQTTANANEVVVKSITAGDNNIGNVDLVTLPAGNLGQRAMAASLSAVPANDIADATYIGDIKFGEALPAGTALIGKVGIDQTTDGTTNKVHAHSGTADDFLANANMQINDTDVSASNPVPVAGTAAHDAAATGNPVQVGGVYRVTDPVLTDGDAGSLRMNAKGEVIVALTGKASSATFTRPNDATAYTAGDVVSTLAGAVGEFTTVGAANELIAILGARFTCAVNAVPAGCTGFYLHLYNAAPTAIADNAAYNLPAADLAKYLGYVVIGQPVDLGDNIVAINDNINHTVKLASTSLYWILQTIGAYTPTANAVKTIFLNVAGV